MDAADRHKLPALEAKKNLLGQIKCPGCGIRFKMSDRSVWTGYRHKSCGQRLLITNVENQAELIWCVVANISDHIPSGPADGMTSGTKHFTAGTKVYCYPPLWGDGYEHIKVIARHRGSKRYVEMIIAAKALINCRAKLVYSPYLLDHLSGCWDETPESREKAEGLASLLNKRNRFAPLNEP
jgi:hypothetical protein